MGAGKEIRVGVWARIGKGVATSQDRSRTRGLTCIPNRRKRGPKRDQAVIWERIGKGIARPQIAIGHGSLFGQPYLLDVLGAFFFLFFSICFPSRLFGGGFSISIGVPLSAFGPALALSVVSNRPDGSDSTSGVERSRTPETRSHVDHVVHGKRVVFTRSIHQEGSESGADKARMEATAPSAATPFMASSVYSS